MALNAFWKRTLQIDQNLFRKWPTWAVQSCLILPDGYPQIKNNIWNGHIKYIYCLIALWTSGGLQLTVKGEYLDVIQDASMRTTLKGKQTGREIQYNTVRLYLQFHLYISRKTNGFYVVYISITKLQESISTLNIYFLHRYSENSMVT